MYWVSVVRASACRPVAGRCAQPNIRVMQCSQLLYRLLTYTLADHRPLRELQDLEICYIQPTITCWFWPCPESYGPRSWGVDVIDGLNFTRIQPQKPHEPQRILMRSFFKRCYFLTFPKRNRRDTLKVLMRESKRSSGMLSNGSWQESKKNPACPCWKLAASYRSDEHCVGEEDAIRMSIYVVRRKHLCTDPL